jgi:ABC-type transport system substrate-binding protein
VTRHRGGTLVLLHTTPRSIDPAVNADLLPPAGVGLTTDGLVTYNHTSGPAGIQLVPDLAVSLPTPTDGGTTYTFRLRPGIRYSDGRLLHASDFRRGAERLLEISSPNRAAVDGVRGAAACDGSGCNLSSGIVTDDVDRTVTYHLVAADPDFLSNLTGFGASVPVPPGTRMTDTGFWGIPGTGPYKVASADARRIHYVRNPFFREWSHAAQPDGNPDEIVTRFGLPAAQEVRAVEAGRADWLAENIPAALLPGLKRRFPSRLHGFAVPTTDFLQVNTTIPPFDDVRVRRALNFALDRAAIVRLYGGPDLARVTCQILPPGVVGYRRYCPYTLGPSADGRWRAPDLARARRLVAASGTRGARVTVWGFTDGPTSGPAVIRATAGVLRRLGYRATVRLVPNMYFGYVHPATARIQLIQGSWGDTAFGYFENWFSCGGLSGHGFFCDPRVDRAIGRAQSLKATNPRAAAAAWSALDRRLVDRAAWVPMVDDQGIDFVSARVQNYQSHPYFGILADQLWLR